MVAGKSNVSKYRNTEDVAWSPAPPSKPKKEILSKMQWHNKRLKILTEEERDIGPYPGKNQ